MKVVNATLPPWLDHYSFATLVYMLHLLQTLIQLCNFNGHRQRFYKSPDAKRGCKGEITRDVLCTGKYERNNTSLLLVKLNFEYL